MKISFASIVVAGLFAASVSTAIGGSGGSAYSILGLGDIRYAPGVRSAGMGYAGLALPGTGYINPYSPATWARLNRTRIEGSFEYTGYNSTDGVRSRLLARADFNGAMLAIPVSTDDGIVLGLGFVPYSVFNYDTYSPGSNYQSPYDTLNYTVHHIGTGGITRGELGLSYAPFSALALGASVNYMFGTLTHSHTQQIVGSNYVGATTSENMTATGVTVTFGAVYTGLGEYVEALRPLSIGFVMTSRGNLKARQQTTFAYASSADTTAELVSRVVIPFNFGIGAAYQIGDRWLVAADYQSQAWSTSEVMSATPVGIRDSYRVNFGAEHVPSRELHATWSERLAYRFGGYYDATYYQPNGQPINQWGVTAGLGFPLSGETRLNVAAEYGNRGTLSEGLIKDRIFKLSFSLNISELWFVRFEEE